eukprot:CAMPEP_0174723420 /NCGR_PEP_ID=MMETSP1094-20130205/40908_1 /TAXON_ID=156173 /ORGANISM="Chrysochromulina brevifilum, Strain UTEX LB 985" /LENGTH=99 /DNA_ID=CAMNT_0015924455 /DNA_START=301 /DNA_END=598 /DNA_ORIENTATION=+
MKRLSRVREGAPKGGGILLDQLLLHCGPEASLVMRAGPMVVQHHATCQVRTWRGHALHVNVAGRIVRLPIDVEYAAPVGGREVAVGGEVANCDVVNGKE